MTSKTIMIGFVALVFVAGSIMTGTMAYADHKSSHQSNAGGLPSVQSQVDQNTAAVDSFFDVFTEISVALGVDSFFDVFTELMATDADLQLQIDDIELLPGPAGPQGEQGPQGDIGSSGLDGVDGSSVIPVVLDGEPWPHNDLGNDGDTAIIVENFLREGGALIGDVYEKIGGQWILQGNIQGPAGANGLPGADGANGLPGADGANGLPGADGANGLPGADGANGLPGADGTSCWDENGDGLFQRSEDKNLDGLANGLDCQGPTGADGADGIGATYLVDNFTCVPGIPGSNSQTCSVSCNSGDKSLIAKSTFDGSESGTPVIGPDSAVLRIDNGLEDRLTLELLCADFAP